MREWLGIVVYCVYIYIVRVARDSGVLCVYI